MSKQGKTKAQVFTPQHGWMEMSGAFPQTVCLTITPSFAEDVLEKRNPRNRRIQKSRARKMARDIVAGKWVITNQGIGFDREGNLLDGQHRLKATALANKPIPTMITFGLEPKSQEVIDDGAKRSDFDVAMIRGADLSKKAVQIGHFLLETLRVAGSPGTKLSKSERQDFYDLHQEALAFAAECMGEGRGWWNKSPIGAVLARAFYHTETEDERKVLRDIGFIMQTGKFVMGTIDENALKLREWVLAHRQERTGESRMILYRKAQSVIRASMEGRILERIMKTKEENFPLPEEKM